MLISNVEIFSRLGENFDYNKVSKRKNRFDEYMMRKSYKDLSIFVENKNLKDAINDAITAVGEEKGIMGKLTVKKGMKDSWRGKLLDFLIKIIDKIVEFIGAILGLRTKPVDISNKCVKMIKNTIEKNPKKFSGFLPPDMLSTDGWSGLIEQGIPKDRDKTNDRDSNRYSKQFNPRPEKDKDKGKSDYPWKTVFDSMFTNNFTEIQAILRNILTNPDKDGFLDDTVMRQIKRIGDNLDMGGFKQLVDNLSLTQMYYNKCYKVAIENPIIEDNKLERVRVDNLYKEMLKRCKTIEQQGVLTDAGGMVNSTSMRRFKTLKRWVNTRRTFLDNITKSPEYKSGDIHYRVQNEYNCIRILNDCFNVYSTSLLQIRQLYNTFSKTIMAYTKLMIDVYNSNEEGAGQ